MQFALLIYHAPEEFAMRENDYNDAHLGAWRAYYIRPRQQRHQRTLDISFFMF